MPDLDPVYEEQAKLIADRVAELLFSGEAVVPEYIGPKKAAVFLGLPIRTLENMRHKLRSDGPPFSRVGRLVRYRVKDLHAYMKRNRA